MSTHTAVCVVCGKGCTCNDEGHVFQAGPVSMCDGEEFTADGEAYVSKVWPPIQRVGVVAFCGEECFLHLLGSMIQRLSIAISLYPVDDGSGWNMGLGLDPANLIAFKEKWGLSEPA